ncbi:GtrA family protein [Noviherbaspirillum sp. 1P10PC]|uniref:GtrA family protein n=1 Tax=Noviherbaspirillum sp. 1P10PC TaxID=3132292 RepID=UPI0039A273F2
MAQLTGLPIKNTVVQAMRFAVVGIASNALGFCWYLLLTWLGMGPKTAMSLLYLIGTLQTFVFNKRWSFQYHGTDKMVLVRYLATYGFGYALNLVMLIILVDYANLPHLIVQATMIVAVAGLTFILQKFWVFAPSNAPLKNSHYDRSI